MAIAYQTERQTAIISLQTTGDYTATGGKAPPGKDSKPRQSTANYSTRLVPTSKHSPCPICEDATGKCRHGQGLTLCMTGAGGHLAGDGYQYIGDSKDGLWGKYLPSDRANQPRRKYSPPPRAKNLPKEVEPKERDRRWREYLGGLSLNSTDRADLHRRGLTDEQIESNGYRSAGNGYLIPVTDLAGLILNCQIRLRNCPSGGRYRWAGHLVGLSNKVAGELPIGIYGNGAELWISEGFLKAGIASHKLGAKFIGFGSVAQLTSSRALIKKTIEEVGPDRVIFAPDAGCFQNRSVMGQYRSFLQDARSWGYTVVVADWGQFWTKDGGDIDELPPGKSINLMAIDEFLRLAGIATGGVACEEHIRKINRSLRPADVVLNLQLLTGHYQLPTDRDVAIRSGLGTGKTEIIAGRVQNARSVVALTHRVALGVNLAERLGLILVNDLDRGGGVTFDQRTGLPANTNRVAACVDSILATPNAPDVLVLDEVSKILRHLLMGKTCKKLRSKLLAAFIDRVRNAGQVILADADLTDLEVYLIEAFRGKKLQVVDNRHKTARSVTMIYSPNETAIIGKGLELVQSGKRVLFLCSQKCTAIQLDTLLDTLLDESDRLLIHGDNSGEPDQKAFLLDPNHYLANYPIKVLTASPTITEGVSITGNYFDAVVGIFHASSIDDQTACQFLRRYRPAVPTWVWVAEGNHHRPRSFTELLNVEAKINAHTIKATGFGGERIKYRSESSTFSYHCRADREWALANLRAATRARLECQGYQVEIVEAPPDREVAEQLKQVKRAQKTARIEAIAAADRIDATAAAAIEKLIKYGQANQTDRDCLAKFLVENFYNVEGANQELVARDNLGRVRKKLTQGETMAKPEYARHSDRQALESLQAQGGEILPQDVPDRYSFAMACQAIGLTDLVSDLMDGYSYTADTDRIKAIGQKARECAHMVRALFGFNPSAKMSSDVQIVGQLLSSIGLKTTSVQKGTGKDRYRIYSLDGDSYQFWAETLRRRHYAQVKAGKIFTHTPLLEKILSGACVFEQGPEKIPTVFDKLQPDRSKPIKIPPDPMTLATA